MSTNKTKKNSFFLVVVIIGIIALMQMCKGYITSVENKDLNKEKQRLAESADNLASQIYSLTDSIGKQKRSLEEMPELLKENEKLQKILNNTLQELIELRKNIHKLPTDSIYIKIQSLEENLNYTKEQYVVVSKNKDRIKYRTKILAQEERIKNLVINVEKEKEEKDNYYDELMELRKLNKQQEKELKKINEEKEFYKKLYKIEKKEKEKIEKLYQKEIELNKLEKEKLKQSNSSNTQLSNRLIKLKQDTTNLSEKLHEIEKERNVLLDSMGRLGVSEKEINSLEKNNKFLKNQIDKNQGIKAYCYNKKGHKIDVQSPKTRKPLFQKLHITYLPNSDLLEEIENKGTFIKILLKGQVENSSPQLSQNKLTGEFTKEFEFGKKLPKGKYEIIVIRDDTGAVLDSLNFNVD